jgi:hypothetical protein
VGSVSGEEINRGVASKVDVQYASFDPGMGVADRWFVCGEVCCELGDGDGLFLVVRCVGSCSAGGGW